MLRARTYGLEAEVRALQAAGLGLGGSLDNAVIITQNGYLNDTVWPDEPAWHKALDLVGDLALLGQPLAGQVLAVRAGHAAHVALARRLLDARPAEV
jgi:UDP-3-O-[3-hydroxymyristoyl] N-acetylglucosamine deacetylase